jgi:hypothetical protein
MMASPPFSTGLQRFPVQRSQIAFISPVGMKVGWEVAVEGTKTFVADQLTVPGRYNFAQGAIYRLKLTDVPNYPGVPFYPTIEVAPATPRSEPYLAHNVIPIEFTDEDFDQVSAGNFVTKVIYLPDPEYQELAIAGVETLVSTRLEPGVDPIAEADRRGTILAIVRMGGIDLELPESPPISPFVGPQAAAPIVPAPQLGPGPSAPAPLMPVVNGPEAVANKPQAGTVVK